MAQLPAPKTFWDRPEGTTGMIVAATGIAAVGGAAYVAVPILLTLAWGIVELTVLGAALTGIGVVATNRRNWIVASYAYRNAMRALTNVVVTIDPIGILKNYVGDLKKHLRAMHEQLDSLRGQMRSLADLITANEQQRTKALKLADVAKGTGKQAAVLLKARMAGRLQHSNLSLQQLYTKMEVLYRVLTKMAETSVFLIEDMTQEIEIKSRERAAVRAAWTAMRAAKKILRGDQDARALFDQSLEFLAEERGRQMGEIEGFVEMSSSFIDSIDLQNGVYEADALQSLEEWERKGDSILLGTEKSTLIEASYDPTRRLDLDAERERELVPVTRAAPNARRYFDGR